METSQANLFADTTALKYAKKRLATMPDKKEAAENCKTWTACKKLLPAALVTTCDEVRESAFEAAKEM